MSFQPIVLTISDDALELPEQQPLQHRRFRKNVVPTVRVPADLEALLLGEYPFAQMVPVASGAVGAQSHPRQGKMLGRHAVCGDTLKLLPISSTHRAIVCPRCFLHVPIPIEIKTYGDLRKYAKDVLLAEKSRISIGAN